MTHITTLALRAGVLPVDVIKTAKWFRWPMKGQVILRPAIGMDPDFDDWARKFRDLRIAAERRDNAKAEGK